MRSNCLSKPPARRTEVRRQSEFDAARVQGRLVDDSLRQHGNFAVYGDLSGGLGEILKDSYVSFTALDASL